jgi:hypothetical protein
MKPVRTVSPLRVVLAVASLAALASAQSAKCLGRENAAFARALLEAGFDDLAEGMTGVTEASDPGGANDFTQFLEVQAVKLDLRQLRAAREADPLRRKDLIVDIIEEKSQFVANNSRTKVAELVRASLPDTYLSLGEAIAQALQRVAPDQSIGLREEGQTHFLQGEAAQQERIDRFQSQIREVSGTDPYALAQLRLAKYNQAKLFYFHALLFPDGSAEQDEWLARANQAFSDYGLDFGETQSAFEGIVFQGLIFKRLGDLDAALTAFSDAIGLRETYVQDDDGVYDAPPLTVDIVSWAVLERARILAEQKRERELLEMTRDFFRSMPDALVSLRGLNVLLAQVRAEETLGEREAFRADAERLVAADPSGPFGSEARRLLAELPGAIGPAQLLKIAESFKDSREWGRALDSCRLAREAAVGSKEESEIGGESFWLEGVIFSSGDEPRLHEAVVAFELVHQLYPTCKRAPEALYWAAKTCKRLNEQERRNFYRVRENERMSTLARAFPNHPQASDAVLLEFGQLEDDGEFARAIEGYLTVRQGSKAYEKSQFQAGNAMFKFAKQLARDGQHGEADAQFATAEEQLQSALRLLDEAQAKELDETRQAAFAEDAFNARGVLCQLYLETARAADVEPLLAEAEQRYAGDSRKTSKLWALRIQSKLGQGEIDAAIGLLDGLAQSDPRSPGIPGAAALIARALDQQAVDLITREPGAPRAKDLWRKAAGYYKLSIRGDSGEVSVAGDDVLQIANRLYAINLTFNGLPETAETFVDWDGPVKEPQLWLDALALYERLLASSSGLGLRIEIAQARTLAILGRMEEADESYARIFDRYQVIDKDKKLIEDVVRNQPELIEAYLEFGVAEQCVGNESGARDKLSRARTVFDGLEKNAARDSRLWWQTRYWKIRALCEGSDYKSAGILLRDTQRTTAQDFDGGRFGLREKFEALEKEIAKKSR